MSTKKEHKKSATRAAPKPAAGTRVKMVSRPTMVKAIGNFLKAHSGFESTVAHDAVISDIEEATTLNEVFLVPLQHKLINMESALKFVLFLWLASSKPIDDSEPAYSSDAAFSTESALEALEGIYDLGIQDAVWDHVEEAREGDGEGDEEKA